MSDNSDPRTENDMDPQDIERLARRETLLKLAATGALGAGGILGLISEALSAGSLPATPGFRRIQVAPDSSFMYSTEPHGCMIS